MKTNIGKSNKAEIGFMPIDTRYFQYKWQKHMPLVSAALIGAALLLILMGLIEAAVLAAVAGLISIVLETAEFKIGQN